MFKLHIIPFLCTIVILSLRSSCVSGRHILTCGSETIDSTLLWELSFKTPSNLVAGDTLYLCSILPRYKFFSFLTAEMNVIHKHLSKYSTSIPWFRMPQTYSASITYNMYISSLNMESYTFWPMNQADLSDLFYHWGGEESMSLNS